MKNYLKRENKIIFGIGTAVGMATLAFLKTKKARDLAVKGVAGSMLLKDKVMENVSNIKEEADDICAEAKLVAQNECICSNDEKVE